MSREPLAFLGAGMASGVGLDAAASCAAIRCGINNFKETHFMDKAGEWIVGSEVPLSEPWRGHSRLVQLLARAVRECLEQAPNATCQQAPLLLCVAEEGRPGRLDGLGNPLFFELQQQLDARFDVTSRIFPDGRVAGALALREARRMMVEAEAEYVLVAGVDSFLTGATLEAYDAVDRILSASNTDGFVPGEAAAALLVGRGERARDGDLLCHGLGFARERATLSAEEPLRADGLVQAVNAALADAGVALGDMDYRLTDLSGEQYGFKEAALALSRTLRQRKQEFDIWHPADCIGEVGAAALPCMLAVALAASRKDYAPGRNVLCHVGTDDGKRAALVLSSVAGSA